MNDPLELIIPKHIDIMVAGKDKRRYKCEINTLNNISNITINPMYELDVEALDLNDKEYLEFFLTTQVNGFISMYEDKTVNSKLIRMKKLVESTTILNHFDYLTFSKDLLTIIDSILVTKDTK